MEALYIFVIECKSQIKGGHSKISTIAHCTPPPNLEKNFFPKNAFLGVLGSLNMNLALVLRFESSVLRYVNF